MKGGDGIDLIIASWHKESPANPRYGADQVYGGEGQIGSALMSIAEATHSQMRTSFVILKMASIKSTLTYQRVTFDDLMISNQGNDCVVFLVNTQHLIIKILNAANLISQDEFDF